MEIRIWGKFGKFIYEDMYFTDGNETFIIGFDTINNQKTIIGLRIEDLQYYYIKQQKQKFYDKVINTLDDIVELPSDISKGIWVEKKFKKINGLSPKIKYFLGEGIFLNIDKTPSGFLVPIDPDTNGVGSYRRISEKNHIKISFSEFINENYNDKFNISHFFRKIKDEFGDEYTNDNWISIKNDLLKDLRKSLELIGNGEIIEKDYYDYPGDRLMYKEYFKDNTRILVVHAAFDKQPYGSTKEFEYEIGVYKNNPTTSQIGGGYGTSGMTTIKHTQLLGSSENYCRNKRVISKLCKFIKKYVEENL